MESRFFLQTGFWHPLPVWTVLYSDQPPWILDVPRQLHIPWQSHPDRPRARHGRLSFPDIAQAIELPTWRNSDSHECPARNRGEYFVENVSRKIEIFIFIDIFSQFLLTFSFNFMQNIYQWEGILWPSWLLTYWLIKARKYSQLGRINNVSKYQETDLQNRDCDRNPQETNNLIGVRADVYYLDDIIS